MNINSPFLTLSNIPFMSARIPSRPCITVRCCWSDVDLCSGNCGQFCTQINISSERRTICNMEKEVECDNGHLAQPPAPGQLCAACKQII